MAVENTHNIKGIFVEFVLYDITTASLPKSCQSNEKTNIDERRYQTKQTQFLITKEHY